FELFVPFCGYSPFRSGHELLHHRRPHLLRLRSIGPRDHDVVSRPDHSREGARADSGCPRHIHWTGRSAIRCNLARANLRSLGRALDPTDNRGTGSKTYNVNAAKRLPFVDANFFGEGLAGICRHGDIDLWLVVVGCGEPCDGHILSIRCDGGTIDRAAIEFPSVLAYRLGLRPFAGAVSSDGNVANFLIGAITINREETVGRCCHRGLAAFANALVDLRLGTESAVGSDCREHQRHVAFVFAGHVSTIEPDRGELPVRSGNERDESMLALRGVTMRNPGLA